ncbi:MAG: DUF1344 domain-containing protein, partial [Alphaproteobacteria bacterium]|nr:DUF1344 domain-containing protein [Alphaproteobacteria bacterium]
HFRIARIKEGLIMKKAMIALVAAVALFAFTDAEAAGMRGFIETVDVESNVLTLDNGTYFILGEDLDAAEYVPGSKVKVRYKSSRGDRIATKILVFSTPND